jgi:PAT family beta-lactamase induction signal transducer AmpG
VEYFGYGFGFVGLMLYMMQQIAPENIKQPTMLLQQEL